MFVLPVSMPRFESIFLNQKSPKMKAFLQKNAQFWNAGGSAPRPHNSPPHCEFLATHLASVQFCLGSYSSEVVNLFITRLALNHQNTSSCRDTAGKFIDQPSYETFFRKF